jgi:riboflavin synthase
MFTGLVETTGVLRRRGGRPVARAFVEASLGPLELGESINVDGACLTVDRILENGFEADLSSETLAKTTLGSLRLGARVHLERATPLGGRLGGHIVLGHVDGIGRVAAVEARGDAVRFEVVAPVELEAFVAPKGSVALNGVSLTVNHVGEGRRDGFSFDVMLVPHTLRRTNLAQLGDFLYVNIEVDVLARYVARRLERASTIERPGEGRGETNEHDVQRDERILAKLRSGGFL